MDHTEKDQRALEPAGSVIGEIIQPFESSHDMIEALRHSLQYDPDSDVERPNGRQIKRLIAIVASGESLLSLQTARNMLDGAAVAFEVMRQLGYSDQELYSALGTLESMTHRGTDTHEKPLRRHQRFMALHNVLAMDQTLNAVDTEEERILRKIITSMERDTDDVAECWQGYIMVRMAPLWARQERQRLVSERLLKRQVPEYPGPVADVQQFQPIGDGLPLTQNEYDAFSSLRAGYEVKNDTIEVTSDLMGMLDHLDVLKNRYKSNEGIELMDDPETAQAELTADISDYFDQYVDVKGSDYVTINAHTSVMFRNDITGIETSAPIANVSTIQGDLVGVQVIDAETLEHTNALLHADDATINRLIMQDTGYDMFSLSLIINDCTIVAKDGRPKLLPPGHTAYVVLYPDQFTILRKE